MSFFRIRDKTILIFFTISEIQAGLALNRELKSVTMADHWNCCITGIIR